VRRLMLCGFVLAVAISELGDMVNAAATNSYDYFCTYDDRSAAPKITKYLTDIFSSTRYSGQLASDWTKYVQATYHTPVTTNGSCILALGDYGKSMRTYAENNAKSNPKVTLIHVDWKE